MDYCQSLLADFVTDYIYGPDDLEDVQPPSKSESNSSSKSHDGNPPEAASVQNQVLGEPEKQMQAPALKLNQDELNSEEQDRYKQSLPPLSESGARIVVVEDENGEQVPAIVLTSQVIRNWNIILKSERRVSEYTSKMFRLMSVFDEFEDRKRKLKQQRMQIREEHEDLTDEEFANLENVEQLQASYQALDLSAAELLEQYHIYKQKLGRAEKAPSAVRSWMEKYWGFVMAENNLLESDDDGDDDLELRQEDHDPIPAERRKPTPSETAREEFYTRLQRQREQIAELEEIVETWQQHYDEELVEYLAAFEDGSCENSGTVFDLCLLEESQEKIGALLQAEKEYDRTLAQARYLGLSIDDGGTESDVISNVDDDRYTLSFEGEMPNSIDKRRIIAWAQGTETEDLNQEPDYEDTNEWEVKSRAPNERDSVVHDMMARGKRRKKIDEWRAVCEAVRRPEISTSERTHSIHIAMPSDISSTKSSPFLSTSIPPSHGLWQSHHAPTYSQSPLSLDFSSSQSSPFLMTPITPAFKSYQIGVRRGAQHSPGEAISPFSIPIQRQG